MKSLSCRSRIKVTPSFPFIHRIMYHMLELVLSDTGDQMADYETKKRKENEKP